MSVMNQASAWSPPLRENLGENLSENLGAPLISPLGTLRREIIGPLQSSVVALASARIGLGDRALRRALAFIEANLGERFSLETLAVATGISRFHFSRLFRATTGQSPMGYLMSIRVERSKGALTRGDRSICEIAAQLGFCDQSHFTRTFRRHIGMSPREYVALTQVAHEI